MDKQILKNIMLTLSSGKLSPLDFKTTCKPFIAHLCSMHFCLVGSFQSIITLSNAKDTTYFTTKCLQTDVASKMEVAMSLK